MSPEETTGGRHTYSLNLLFLLMAAGAVISALMAPVARSIAVGNIGLPEAVASSISGGMLVATLGAAIGLYHYRQLRGCSWGILTGFLLGVVLGPLSLIPINQAAPIHSLMLIGSVVLICVGFLFRFTSRFSNEGDARES